MELKGCTGRNCGYRSLLHGLAPSVLAPDNDLGTLRTNFLGMILVRRDRKNLASAIGLSDVALPNRKRTR